MSLWVLVLIIHFGAGGAAIESIEFSSEKSCEAARVKWIKSTANNKTDDAISAVCISRLSK